MADAKNRKIEKSLREEQAAATSARGCVQVGGGAMSGDVERLELRLKQLALEYKAVVERLAKKNTPKLDSEARGSGEQKHHCQSGVSAG